MIIFVSALGLKVYNYFTGDNIDVVKETKQFINPQSPASYKNEPKQQDEHSSQIESPEQKSISPSKELKENSVVKKPASSRLNTPQQNTNEKEKNIEQKQTNQVDKSSDQEKVSTISQKFPGREYFKLNAKNEYVTQLGQLLVNAGYGKYYQEGPNSTFTQADQKNCQSFQVAQGWVGKDADGYPGPETWNRLVKIWNQKH
ncbi:peptidoglycan-binding protein [Seinonella peptonophila]|uniref:peptidoglycan-binding protein n=1 Tax=Seinonella peptonophila TaxID=112248 RepID=UPI00111481E6|nr:peptidoglycan-binding protein [Seinonella peptonophila]